MCGDSFLDIFDQRASPIKVECDVADHFDLVAYEGSS